LLSERAHALQAIRETIKTALAPRLATLSAELSSEIGEQLCESLPEDIADQVCTSTLIICINNFTFIKRDLHFFQFFWCLAWRRIVVRIVVAHFLICSSAVP
jgi:hypothetical protein